MASHFLDFSQYETLDSKFTAELADNGGHINFSNSGKRGVRKYFTLSLSSFQRCLIDIKENLSEFEDHELYNEKDWRDLGSEYYSDQPAHAQCTVQTKPMFTTLSKIIMWANSLSLDDIDPELNIRLDELSLTNAIERLEEIILSFTPKVVEPLRHESIVLSNSSIREFALEVFEYFYGENWSVLLKDSSVKDSTINDLNYELYDFGVFKNLIGSFEEPQHKKTLSSSNTLRYFETPVYTDDLRYYYFTTQWNANSDRSLSFENIKKHFESIYPNYSLENREGVFMLLSNKIEPEDFNLSSFKSACDNAGLIYSPQLLARFAASLATKPFVLLTGLSGSGKTKLAQAFAQWICASKEQYCIVPVGADWTNREPLLGYVNALNDKQYILPENGALELIIRANENKSKPYFLILDEMNLSHVERYFADFLSIMESDEPLKLHSADENLNNNRHEDFENAIEVPSQLGWPENLFVIGTVNIDETTYMFSPKVLDRANVIEFRIDESDLAEYLKPSNGQLDMSKLYEENSKVGKGACYGESFVSIAKNRVAVKENATLNQELRKFFVELQKIGAEFGFRSASEIQTLYNQLDVINPTYSTKVNDKIDIAIMQKLLPKLHGSRSKLVPVLKVLASLCYTGSFKEEKLQDIFENADEYKDQINYTISLEKITRMYRNVIDNGFTSYAEA